MVLLPQKKTQKKLREVLNQQYAHLDSPGGGNAAEVDNFWYKFIIPNIIVVALTRLQFYLVELAAEYISIPRLR